jgi:hypothetical protein
MEVMATGYTHAELNALAHLMDEAAPPIPTEDEKQLTAIVLAMRAAGTEKGILLNLESNERGQELFWLNCWVAKELVSAIESGNMHFGWSRFGLLGGSDDCLLEPKISDLTTAAHVISLATWGEPSGIRIRFVIDRWSQTDLPVKDIVLFLPIQAALEAMDIVTQCAKIAGWCSGDFELIPSRESQH